MSTLRSRLADPFVGSVLLAASLALAGLIALGLTWAAVAARVEISEQVPYVISGGFTGVALIGFGCGVLVIQRRRWVTAHRRAEVGQAIVAATELLAAVRGEANRD